MFHPSIKKPEVPLIRRGVAESAALLVLLGIIFVFGTLHADKMWGIGAGIAFGGAAVLLALEIVTWVKGKPSKVKVQ